MFRSVISPSSRLAEKLQILLIYPPVLRTGVVSVPFLPWMWQVDWSWLREATSSVIFIGSPAFEAEAQLP